MTAEIENIGIIGVGRLGYQLAIMLKEADYQISTIIDRDTYQAIKCMNECNALVSSDVISDIDETITMLFICVQDDHISNIADELAKNEKLKENLVIAHTSGLHTSDILQSIRKKNVHLCSFHPCYSFTKENNDLPEDIYYVIEGDDTGYQRLKEIAECLGGKVFRIRKNEKAVYHTACSMASNYLIGLMNIVEKFLRLNIENKNTDFLWPLVQGTLGHIKKKGIKNALTGPITRGDVNTIEHHIKTLKHFDKKVVDLYIYMGEQLLNIIDNQELTAEKIKKIKKIFNKYKTGKIFK